MYTENRAFVGTRFSNAAFGDEHTIVFHIEERLDSKDQLLSIISRKLSFPNYFGENWDALLDCLSDFHWVTQENIIILLSGGIEDEIRDIFLEVVHEAVDKLENSIGRKRLSAYICRN